METLRSINDQCRTAIGNMIETSGFVEFEVNGRKFLGSVFELDKELTSVTERTVDEYYKLVDDAVERQAEWFEWKVGTTHPKESYMDTSGDRIDNLSISLSEPEEKLKRHQPFKVAIDKAVALHLKWLTDEEGGVRANLMGANLEDANLEGANLEGANLEYANLKGANLKDANLKGTYLYGADLRGANLRDADFEDADLTCANFVMVRWN